MSFSERLELAQSIKYADVVVAQQDYSPFENIRKLKPNILMESDSHDDSQIAEGRRLIESQGGSVIVMPYFQGQSSTAIEEKIRN